jgi:hypothetical protein
MIEPRCLIKADDRSRLLRDDFAVWENGFIGPALATYSQARSIDTGLERPDARARFLEQSGASVPRPRK